MKDWLGSYRLIRRLDAHGTRPVYAAEDARLGRNVALKTLRREGSDLGQRERLLREARVAASVSQPGICQVFEVGEADGEMFIAMELLEGESLSARVARGPVPAREAATIVLDLLAALHVLHENGLVHRALRPSSVFLTPHGPKLLDFALARPPDGTGARVRPDRAPPDEAGPSEYLAPEQLLGAPCDRRTDLWAVGAILCELLTGKPPFTGTPDEVRRAIVDAPVPALVGQPGAEFLERSVRRALARSAAERYATAAAMMQDLQASIEAIDSSGADRASRMTRLIVLPLRLLKPDPDIEFLAFSLADAISVSLSSLGSLIVRSSLMGSQPVTETLDLHGLARQADVDVAVTGTLLRAGDQARVSLQLLEVPGGTVLWSQARQMSLDRLFDLQDELATGIAESLAMPLTAREHRLLRHDVPATPRAYEHYLRANQLAYDAATWPEARRLYAECVQEDPQFAPAWARLGRMYRVWAKYGLAPDPERAFLEADAALKRALDLNPDLPIAHTLYAALEADTGRADQAVRRLVTRAAARRGDVDLRVGLVQACRICGLLDASAAAHAQARRLDARIPTSVLHTWWAMGEHGRVLDPAERGTDPIKGLVLATLGRTGEAIAVLTEEEQRFALNRGMSTFARMMRLALEGQVEPVRELAADIARLTVQDPEANYYVARTLAWVGDRDGALGLLTRAVQGGYSCVPILRTDPWLEGLRPAPPFARLLERALEHHRGAARVFKEAGGEALLGVTISV